MLALLAGLTLACTGEGDSAPPVRPARPPSPASPPAHTAQASAAPSVAPSAREPGELALTNPADAGADASSAPYPGPRIGAMAQVTLIMSDMEWPRDDARKSDKSDRGGKPAVRLGYLRKGAKAPVVPKAHVKPNCTDGWYELVAGGFVCGRYATLDLNHPQIRNAARLPDMEGPLPYQYGYNTTNGAPLYRSVPSREERIRLEPWLSGGTAKKKPRRDPDEPSAPEVTVQADPDAGGTGLAFATARAQDPPAEPEVPWYMRDAGAGKPQVTLDDLRGEGPIARRMVKGFYVALDHQFASGGWSWWKTTGGLLAPADRIYVQKPLTDFHGIWLSDRPGAQGTESGSAQNPNIGFALYRTRKYTLSPDGKRATAGEPVARHTIVKLTGKNAIVGGVRYDETEDGWWLRVNEGARTKPGPKPADLGPNEKWIDVSLSTQTLIAYEGEKPVYATLVSTGRRDMQNKQKDYPTPQGSYRIREKHIAATMDGDVASDGPYSIEDVPWIMYFNGSYALHGAFWHASFGQVRSHGCVNLAPADAKAVFGWTEPRVPEGWHGANATASNPGTRVVVHD